MPPKIEGYSPGIRDLALARLGLPTQFAKITERIDTRLIDPGIR